MHDSRNARSRFKSELHMSRRRKRAIDFFHDRANNSTWNEPLSTSRSLSINAIAETAESAIAAGCQIAHVRTRGYRSPDTRACRTIYCIAYVEKQSSNIRCTGNGHVSLSHVRTTTMIEFLCSHMRSRY